MKIAIFGDSWAYGCFKKLPNFKEQLVDLTFQKMFRDHNIIADNYAICGGTNLDTLEQIRAHGKNYDMLIVFQTDPIRQCVTGADDRLTISPSIQLPESKTFEELCEKLLQDFYQELDKISIGCDVILIGGCAKLSFNHIPKKFITLSQSWTELLTPEFTDCYYYWIEPTLCLYENARKKFNWKSSLSDFFEFEKQIMNKNYIWQTSDNFSWCHAAKPAYEIMFTKINQLINNLDKSYKGVLENVNSETSH